MVCRGDAGGCRRPKKGRKKRTERGELRFPTKGFGDVTVFFKAIKEKHLLIFYRFLKGRLHDFTLQIVCNGGNS